MEQSKITYHIEKDLDIHTRFICSDTYTSVNRPAV